MMEEGQQDVRVLDGKDGRVLVFEWKGQMGIGIIRCMLMCFKGGMKS